MFGKEKSGNSFDDCGTPWETGRNFSRMLRARVFCDFLYVLCLCSSYGFCLAVACASFVWRSFLLESSVTCNNAS
ncbi:unnamed protein product [Sphagnum jensenii]|uniref:Transmembrane protein n=1 Tax=Sphagnum jensenii TaxID=128206 RepID=A0ABP0W140_9BRYO